jgi:lipid-A-disaccharide synthase
VLCLFRFEVGTLRSEGVDAVWVGHPLAERVEGLRDRAVRRTSSAPCVAVLPGSRGSEVARHLPPFLAAARQALGGEGEIVVPWRLAEAPPEQPGVRFDRRDGLDVLAEADAAIVAVGTAALESAALGVPTVAAVRLHPATAAVGRRLLRTSSVALPNVLLGERVIEEHVQELGGLAGGLRRLLDDLPGAATRAEAIARRLGDELGPPGFAARVADCLLPLLQD